MVRIKEVVLIIFLVAASQAQAARIYVNANASGGNDGASWGSAFTNLTTAISVSVSGDTVWVVAGTYKPTSGTDRSISFSMKSGVAIYGGFAGTENLLTQRNVLAHETKLSGDLNGDDGVNFSNYADNSYHVINNVAVNNAVLDGFTISSGNADGTSLESCGGAILQSNSSPTFRNISFKGNRATVGGAYYSQNNSNPLIMDCLFENNRAFDTGGAFSTGSYNSPIVMRTIFINNKSDNIAGAVHNDAYSTASYINCLFTANTAPRGGGMFNDQYCATKVGLCSFANNSSSDRGAGIFTTYFATATIHNSIIWNGSSSVFNELFVPFSGVTTITYSCIEAGIGYDGSHNSSADPLFINAMDPDGADNSWFTDDDGLQLTCASPSINLGNNDSIVGVTTDLRGAARILGNLVDMGAYELYLPTITASSNPSSKKICHNLSLTLSGSGAASYAWDNGATDKTPFIPAATTKYTLTGTAANGCTDTTSISIEVVKPQNPVIATSPIGPPGVIYRCGGGRTQIHPTSGGPYFRWQERTGGDGLCIRIENTAGAYFDADANGDISLTSGSGSGSGSTGGLIIGNSIILTSVTSGDYIDLRPNKDSSACDLNFVKQGDGSLLVISLDSVNGNACYSEQGYYLTLQNTNSILFNVGSDVTLCDGNSIVIGDNTVYTDPSIYQYSWAPTSGLNSTNAATTNASPTSSTTYIATKTNTATGCSVADTVQVTVDNCTSLLPTIPSADLLQLFPNPSTGRVQVFYEVARASDLVLKLEDAQGKAHYIDQRINFQGQFTPELNFGNLPKGIYYLSVRTDKEVQTRKLIIE